MERQDPCRRDSQLTDPTPNPDHSGPAHPTGPVRRAYAPVPGKSRDVDSFEQVVRFRVLGWSIVGAFIGFLFGVFLSLQGWGGWIIAVTTVIGWTVSFFGVHALLAGAGRAGSTLYAPSGRSTPRKKEYSLAESFVARGEYRRAVDTFEEAIADDPSDPTPYLRLARIHRDKLEEPAEAAAWFKRALTEATAPPGVRLLALRELVELYTVRLGQPGKAAPILARIADESASTAEGAWAAEELARIKEAMRTDDDAP